MPHTETQCNLSKSKRLQKSNQIDNNQAINSKGNCYCLESFAEIAFEKKTKKRNPSLRRKYHAQMGRTVRFTNY